MQAPPRSLDLLCGTRVPALKFKGAYSEADTMLELLNPRADANGVTDEPSAKAT